MRKGARKYETWSREESIKRCKNDLDNWNQKQMRTLTYNVKKILWKMQTKCVNRLKVSAEK